MRSSDRCMFLIRFPSPDPGFTAVLHSLDAMAHPRCVGWGEIGLDYHYDNSPRDVQQRVFARQLREAIKLGKPLTIHTREAEEDTERILKQEVPPDHKVRSLSHVPFFFLAAVVHSC
jgi:Tat protein secretion system quality control protein TatD with DNase activity